jgi:hypothetical protein
MKTKRTSSQDLLADHVDLLRKNLKGVDPSVIAERSGVVFDSETEAGADLHLSLWGRPVCASFPALIARYDDSSEALPPHLQALLMYYFLTCDGTRPTGQWLSFSQLPDGRFYDQAFQGYTGSLLSRTFGEDLEAFCAAAESFSGSREFRLGTAAYRFQALPYVPLLAVFWLGDEDFPSSCQILFDSAVSHHLPTDACAILGSHLTKQLIKYVEQSHENRHQR